MLGLSVLVQVHRSTGGGGHHCRVNMTFHLISQLVDKVRESHLDQWRRVRRWRRGQEMAAADCLVYMLHNMATEGNLHSLTHKCQLLKSQGLPLSTSKNA